VPFVIPIGVGLAAAMALLVALSLQLGYRQVFYELLLDFAERLESVSIGVWRASGHPLAPVGRLVRWLAIKVDEGLSFVVLAFESPFVWLLNQVARVLENVGDELGSLAEDVAQALDRVRRIAVPAAITAATLPILLPLKALQATVRYMSSTALPALGHAIDVAGDRIGRLERAAAGQLGRLGRLERLSVGLAASGVALWALSRVGLSWLRCRNVTRLGKQACRTDPDLLEALIADTLLVFGAFSLVEFAREMQRVTPEVADAVRTVTRVA
jgi:hypothetical protein